MSTTATRPLRPLRTLRSRPPLVPTLSAALAAAALGVALTITTMLGVLRVVDAQWFAVQSDSMTPAFARGDLVITRAVEELRVGDAVTFRKYGKLVTHRIVALGRAVGTYQTRGDANRADDPWTITKADVVGTVRAVVHNAGFPLLLLESPSGRVLVGNSIAGLVILLWWATPRAARVPAILLHPSSGYAIR